MTTRYHAEHVGSLLRPPGLLEARWGHARGSVTGERLRELEDAAVLSAIDLQRRAGIEVFTDGEMRRGTWMAGLLEALDGVVAVPSGTARVAWHRDRGGAPSLEDTDFDMVVASGKLSQRAWLTSAEASFLAEHAHGQYKITMISAAMGPMIWRPDLSAAAYRTPADMLRDLVSLKAGEIEGLVDQGVNWIQLDSLSYVQVIDEAFRSQTAQGVDPAILLDAAVTIDNQLISAARARNPEVVVGLHVCRGNNRSAWMAEGSYEPVAERLFSEVDADRFLLEYDTARAGGFEPLRFVPRGKTVVLGLVSSKVGDLESPDDLRRRIDEASAYVPLEDLALSPQCGFASTAPGNMLTVDEEQRKLELVADTARRVWG